MSANGAVCPGDPGKVTAFDAPEAWDGTCTAMDAIPSAASLLASPPYLKNQMCFPTPAPPIKIADGKTRALLCQGFDRLPGQYCANPSETCTMKKVPGFLFCVEQGGDQTCPDGWPEKHLYYDDNQECGCECGPPVGDHCTTTLTVYSDSACMTQLTTVQLSSDQAQTCVSTPTSPPYGSKASSSLVYQSGKCMPIPSSGPVTTYCCQQP
jgi:hypothetical protein